MSWIEKISNWQTNQKIAITSDLVIIAWLVTNSLVDLINELSDQVTCLTPVIQSSACPREVDRLRVWGTCLFLSFGLHTQCCVSSLHQFDLSFVKYTFSNHVEIISDDDRYQMSQRGSQNGFILWSLYRKMFLFFNVFESKINCIKHVWFQHYLK